MCRASRRIRQDLRQGDGTVILGRDDGPSGATVKVPAESVSRRHARMQFENGRWKTVPDGWTVMDVTSGRRFRGR